MENSGIDVLTPEEKVLGEQAIVEFGEAMGVKKAQKKMGLMVRYQQAGNEIEQKLNSLQVIDEPSRAIAADTREQARQYDKEIFDEFDPDRDDAYQHYLKVKTRVEKMRAPFKRIMKAADDKMDAYLREEKHKRQEAQDKIDREAAEAKQREIDRLDKLAEKQMDAGRFDKAEETIAKAEDVASAPTPTIPSLDKTVKTESGGTSSFLDFDLAIENALTVIKDISAGRLPFGLAKLDINKNEIRITGGALKDYAKLQIVNGKLPIIPGCRLTEKFRFSGRSK